MSKHNSTTSAAAASGNKVGGAAALGATLPTRATMQPQQVYDGARASDVYTSAAGHDHSNQMPQAWSQPYGMYGGGGAGAATGAEASTRHERKLPAFASYDQTMRGPPMVAHPGGSMQPPPTTGPTLDSSGMTTHTGSGPYAASAVSGPYTAAMFAPGATPNAPFGRSSGNAFGSDAPTGYGHSRYASMSSAYDMPLSRSFDAPYTTGATQFPTSPMSARVTLKAKRKRASPQQLGLLNNIFEKTFFPSTELRNALGKELAMTSRTVQIWFQNRRQAWRTQRGKDAHMSDTISNDNERAAWEVFRDFQAKRASGELPTINNVGDTGDALTISTSHATGEGLRRASMSSDRTALRTASSFAQSTPRQTPRSATYEHGPLSAGMYDTQTSMMQPMSPYVRNVPGGMSMGDGGQQQQNSVVPQSAGVSIKRELSSAGMLPPLQATGGAQVANTSWGQTERYAPSQSMYGRPNG